MNSRSITTDADRTAVARIAARASRRWRAVPGIIGLLAATSLAAQTIDFEFEQADLRTVIKAVAEFTGRNFLVDPKVQGTVTVVSPKPLDADEAYRAFLEILDVNGYVAIEGDGLVKIVSEEEAKTQQQVFKDPALAPQGTDLVTRVITFQHVIAERLVPILRPLVAAYGHLGADPGAKTLVVTDRAANVERIVAIARGLDRPVNTGELVMLTLTHASAAELAALLNQLYQPGPADSAAAGLTAVLADTRTNSLLIKADAATRQQILRAATELDQPVAASGDTHVIYLKNADAENVVEVLRKAAAESAKDAPGALPAAVGLTADPDTNAVIITAAKSEFTTLQRVIEQLDVRRLQVYVEALIAEVATDKVREVGVQWQTADGLRGDRRGAIGGTNFTLGASITDVILNPLAAGAGISLGYADGTFTLPDGTEVTSLSVLARALDRQRHVNVLSTPNILTLDNQSAEIVIGQNVPFVTGSYSNTDAGTGVSNPFQTIQREDVGLTLRIKPQITEGSTVKLEIFQEVSSVAQKGEAFDIVTNTRSLATTIIADDNRMVVLGGLIQEDRSVNEQRVPVLGALPIVGNLFRYQNRSRVKTNLLIFLRPHIVRGSPDLDGPTQRKYSYLDQLLDQADGKPAASVPAPIAEWERFGPDAAGGTEPEAP